MIGARACTSTHARLYILIVKKQCRLQEGISKLAPRVLKLHLGKREEDGSVLQRSTAEKHHVGRMAHKCTSHIFSNGPAFLQTLWNYRQLHIAQ